MKPNVLPIVNVIGCVLLLGIVGMQWQQSEQQREAYRAIQVREHAANEARDEAVKRAEALTVDLTELKQSLVQTQKAADEAALASQKKGEQLAVSTASRDQALAERDALQKQIVEWEAALKLRDQTITEQNAAMIALRKKLDDAIAQLKKAGAQ